MHTVEVSPEINLGSQLGAECCSTVIIRNEVVPEYYTHSAITPLAALQLGIQFKVLANACKAIHVLTALYLQDCLSSCALCDNLMNLNKAFCRPCRGARSAAA